ncbi:VOC family protein [Chloroflexota bacterium]
MARKSEHRLAHICILVRDIDKAIEHYANVLSAVAPQMQEQKIVKQEAFAGKDRYLTAFFPSAGEGCDIQLLQPLGKESPLYKRLERHGEGMHHICFSTKRLEDTFRQLKNQGVSLHGEQFIADINNPYLRWFWVLPQYTHGVLIEVIDDYDLAEGILTRDESTLK